jgi:predicted RNA-binding protein (TIGR00451 family)|tara:strand:+ start:5443 stop:6000 length:558 start_codon:yes stop_codon:yes gene_type:complete
MFRKFTPGDNVSALQQIKSSVQRGIRTSIAEQFPQLEEEDVLDELIPKKCTMNIAKTDAKVNVVLVDGVPLFFQLRDGPFFPTLRLLHKYPDCMPKLRVDAGAIRFVFGGANIMCPGLTSPGAEIVDDVPEDTPVAIYAEGKTHALAVGITKMSTADIKSINKGVGVDTIHHLNDGLWGCHTFDA